MIIFIYSLVHIFVMKNIIVSVIAGLFLVSFVCADAILPGQRIISITNVITNMDDYPDYTFFQVGYLSPSMCPTQAITSEGVVPGGYKHCDFSVFAVPKSEFGDSFTSDVEKAFEDINVRARNSQTPVIVQEELDSYLVSRGAKKVISGIHLSKMVPEESPEQSYTEYYTVDLSSVQEKPRNTEIINNYLTYLYVGIPIVALIVIVLLLLKKRR